MISVYIHIPFCHKICTYCDFCKLYRHDNWINSYLDALEKEITQNYHHEEVKTLYIGGGTPSTLNLKELGKLFQIINKLNINKNAEITFEANSEDLTEEKLKFLKKHVNRLSIGIQTFDKKRLKTLNRTLNIDNVKNALKTFKNVNLDLMYGFHNQTLDDLKQDLFKITALNPPHISLYSLILEPHTVFYNQKYQRLDDNHDRQMYDYITSYFKEKGYNHYEISNYSKEGYESKHNLTYWNNENYYGFGLGASGYLNNIRYENTRSLNEYLKGNYLKEKIILSKEETIENEFICGLRKIKGISISKFTQKYQINPLNYKVVKDLLNQKLLIKHKDNLYINKDYLYVSNEILIKFLNTLYTN